jgi:hypothetical protein
MLQTLVSIASEKNIEDVPHSSRHSVKFAATSDCNDGIIIEINKFNIIFGPIKM